MSSRAIAIVTVLLLSFAVLAPVAAQEPEDAAPVPSFTVSKGAVVFGAVTFTATAVDEDPESVVFAWDFDPVEGEDFEADASGAEVEHAFQTPGVHQVTLRATDAAGNSATVTRAVSVDDFFTLSFTFTEKPTQAEAMSASVTLADWSGEGVANRPVTLGILYQPQRDGYAVVVRSLTVTTGEDGTVAFDIPTDTAAGNVYGRHVVTAHAAIPNTVLGDAESVTIRMPYVIGLPSL